jgi:hypothetical protein
VRRVGATAALAAACLAVAGCGGNGVKVPHGNPDARHGAETVDAYASVELLRALLFASSDSYYAGGSAEDARRQLERARTAYDALASRVQAGDPVVNREVTVRFDHVARVLRQGIAPDRYRDVVNPLADQLMDGVSQALVPPHARSDAGVQAEALKRITMRLAATYGAAISSSADDASGRLAFEESWGLWRRAQALDLLVAADLGDQKDAVAAAIDNLRQPAFPKGPVRPDKPAPAKVEAASAKILRTLDKRFGLQAI